jgi:hypothetical protein
VTEAEWLAATNPEPMLEHLRQMGAAGDRKLRLFAAAAVRRVCHRIFHPLSLRTVDVAESFIEGRASVDELNAAHRDANAAYVPFRTPWSWNGHNTTCKLALPEWQSDGCPA